MLEIIARLAETIINFRRFNVPKDDNRGLDSCAMVTYLAFILLYQVAIFAMDVPGETFLVINDSM